MTKIHLSSYFYSELKNALLSQLARSLAPDLMDVPPLDLARALRGLTQAGEIDMLLVSY